MYKDSITTMLPSYPSRVYPRVKFKWIEPDADDKAFVMFSDDDIILGRELDQMEKDSITIIRPSSYSPRDECQLIKLRPDTMINRRNSVTRKTKRGEEQTWRRFRPSRPKQTVHEDEKEASRKISTRA